MDKKSILKNNNNISDSNKNKNVSFNISENEIKQKKPEDKMLKNFLFRKRQQNEKLNATNLNYFK